MSVKEEMPLKIMMRHVLYRGGENAVFVSLD